MEQADLLEQLKKVTEVEDAVKAYQAFWAMEEACDTALEVLARASVHPESLADAGTKMQLRLILLGLAVRKEHQAYGDFRKMICSPVFLENVDHEDWLVIEIPRLLGLFGAPGCLQDIIALIQDEDCQTEIREQVMMAMIFRWLGRQESDGDVYAAVRDMLENSQGNLAQKSQLGMALVVNAIAVGGSRLKTQIMNFVKNGSDELRKNVSEKNIRSFLSLGSQRVKDMLKQNYEGPFKEPEYEIDLMIHPRTDEQTISPNAGKPIVRDEPKIGRNDPCPCGSGKKYKKCCGK